MLTSLLNMATHEPERWAWAGGGTAAYLLWCLAVALGRKPQPRARVEGELDYLVLFASQTGQAEELARAAADRLGASGFSVSARSVRGLTAEVFQSARQIVVVAATTGQGDAPDDAIAFERKLMAAPLDLSGRQFAVLALGDRSYEDFCAFGRRIHDWLQVSGAEPLASCLEVDDLDPKALAAWDAQLETWGAAHASEAPVEAQYGQWVLSGRRHLNPQSPSAPLYQIDLTAPADTSGDWVAGDLAEILTPDGHRRDYSIASLPHEGHVRLFVRLVIKDDGSRGLGSGFLTETLQPGQTLHLKLRSHKGFHAPEGEGPVLLIGAGSGLAGLRAHILTLSDLERPLWLIYGERHPEQDGALIEGLKGWLGEGRLKRLHLAYSRPEAGERQYVQDVLRAAGDEVRRFLIDRGSVMVCGGLDMGRDVHDVLKTLMGDDWIDTALSDGRYRRDLY